MERDILPHLLETLASGHSLLELAAQAPDRVPVWDAVVVTAASGHQARIYERQLEAARRRGILGERTRALVVPDPQGARIGSGGATLHALQACCRDLGGLATVARMGILLIHAGGDSKRLPWANVMGKLFVPFPLLATPDSAVPTLFELLTACTAAVPANRGASGMLFSLTGDVLPLFDSALFHAPPDAACVATTPVSLDVAGRHGVIVPAHEGTLATNLLQKPGLPELIQANALVQGGAALVDTGIYAFTGRAFQALLELAQADPPPVQTLLDSGVECSLYEEIAAGFVPARHASLDTHPIGPAIRAHLSHCRLHHHATSPFAFIHIGSSKEYLQHMSAQWFGHLPRRVLARTGPASSPRSFCYVSELDDAVRLGAGSVVLDSSLGEGVSIGNRCLVSDVHAADETFALPDNLCLWQVPVDYQDIPDGVVTLCCGVDDNPKLPFESATFLNRSFPTWLRGHQVDPEEIWPDSETRRTLWNARLFPVRTPAGGLLLVSWLLSPDADDPLLRDTWRQAPRLSLAEVHRHVDTDALIQRNTQHRDRLLMQTIRSTVFAGLDRNVRALGIQLGATQFRERAASLVGTAGTPGNAGRLLPTSRQLQIEADLLAVAGRPRQAADRAENAFRAVSAEVSARVQRMQRAAVSDIPADRHLTVELPVRFDFAGGWSDTPPYCLERPAGVLNMAMTLFGEKPVQVEAQALDEPRWELLMADSGRRIVIQNTREAGRVGDLADPFALLRSALVLTGYGSEDGISQGVRLVTRADVPRGSGLGTSSILGAAVVDALQKLSGGDDDYETISDMVLNLEQMMTTGGGWQDQIGGLVPGVKFVSSVPLTPLSLCIEPVPLLPEVHQELHQRLVIAFSGKERLAKNVLEIVVGRYLQRDNRLLEAIEGLVSLAQQARKSLAVGDLDNLGAILRQVWMLHQQLDPQCSNPDVDAILRSVDDLASGYKLVGAGGGGFMGVLAKDAEAAGRIRTRLTQYGHGVTVYDWDLAEDQ